MNDTSAVAANVYAQNNAYTDNKAHREHDPYKGNDPYKRDDPYKKNESLQAERKKPWSLDFEMVRFFRENFNAGIDFEESPRAFFDEEYMLAIRIRLLSRNFMTMLIKFIFMVVFSAVTLLLTARGVMIFGLFYLGIFLYYIAVPIAFVKYSRQYIIDDSARGKLKKVHDTYAKWMRPLESITMNILTVVFVAIEIFMFFNIEHIYKYINLAASYTKAPPLINYVSSLKLENMQESIVLTIAFYASAYFIYWVFIYKFWSPKWEEKRKENEKAFMRTNQRTAKNLKDELTKGEF
jgi:hypothetical protein